MDLLFKNVTAVTMDEDILSNVNVGITNGVISYIGSGEAPKAERVIDGEGKLLFPSLYNCHTHTPMSLLRGVGNDLALEDWLFNHIFPAEQRIKEVQNAVYTGAMLSIAEMISSGTTSFNDMYFGLPQVAKAALEAGVKANLSNGVISFNPEGYDYFSTADYEETLHVLTNYHNTSGGRIKAEVSLHCAYTTHPKAWQQCAEYASKNNLSMHVHLSETVTEHNKNIEQFGLTPAAAFSKYGVFDVPAVAAHACHVTEEDIDILAGHGVTVAHNPVSNLKLASGAAPVTKMMAKGINIALGTDGMASNNTHDLFEEIKLASILHKYAEKDPTALPAKEVLKMATVNGARAQGRKGGQIKEGLDADLILIDFDSPRQVPCTDPAISLAYSTTGRDVVMTLCQGRILYENGEYKTIDIEKIIYDAKEISAKVV